MVFPFKGCFLAALAMLFTAAMPLISYAQVACTSDASCADGVFCNGAEFCNALGFCESGTISISDGIACTIDSCDEATDSIIHTPQDIFCSDGQFCNGEEICSAATGCVAGSAPPIDDGVACTIDSCNEATDTITHATNDAFCSDGEFCNGEEFCSVLNGCEAGIAPSVDDGLPCTIDSCDEATDSAVHSPDNSLCSDGSFCNGEETCDTTAGCVSGVPPTLDDGISCTTDLCDEQAKAILHITDNNLCSDGQFCNGEEICSAALGCVAGSVPPIDDGVACTIDSCNEATDTITHATNDAFCSDGEFCNGDEVCSALNGCVAGEAPVIDDGDSCTNDSCDEVNDEVINQISENCSNQIPFPWVTYLLLASNLVLIVSLIVHKRKLS